MSNAAWILWPEISVVEKMARPLAIYVFLIVAFRLAGKRELGQMTPLDLVVLLTISNVLQNAMIGPDNSLGGGLIGAATLLTLNGVLSRIAFRSPAVARLLESPPTPLIEDGRILSQNLRREVMTMAELEHAIRKHDLDPATDLPLIKRALLEEDGGVTIVRRANGDDGR